ncbi:ATP-binding/permease protein CydD [Corynebacterium kalinowskii]|uniref:ATP-binding/permease protein CydD n=1 Tax=Corynebacterium kalinowskii TaxID=2675216 RepID=A0A6B8VIF2_9CORY|nr:ATP-binding cassette domain-containing protein [Corynebacterium kalinowskii]QGU01334.1 ATP-binding/permease protein CydD [Corynebacterium kalinowskii]
MASPLNQRLLAAAPAARRHLVLTGIAQAADTVLTVARAALIGTAAAVLIEQDVIRWELVYALAGVVLAQAGVAFVARRWASKSTGEAVDELRLAALKALERRDPRQVEEDSAMWRTTLTSGLEGVRPYLTEYVPALIATCLATPIALATLLYYDAPSAILAAATIPLIPLFMVLIGVLTRTHTQRRLEVTSTLSDQLSDLMLGAPTLRALGVTKAPVSQLRKTGETHETATMSVLRLAFLSSFALEFLATLSVALVAVWIGLRLVEGDMTLLSGLVALIIVPEVYAPLRKVGASFHASVDGMTAAEQVFDLIDSPGTLDGSYVSSGSAEIRVQDLSVRGRDGVTPTGLSFTAIPGRITVLHGPNGSGKSTALLAVLGLLPDSAVSGHIEAPSLSDIAYLPAHPALVGGTVGDNLVLLGALPTATTHSSAEVGLDIPLTQAVHSGGAGISAGQAQRLALARVLALDAPCLLLDEPTAHLSPELVIRLTELLQREAQRGRVLLISSHDPRILAIADQVVQL